MINAKLVELIYTEVTKGDGTKENPTHIVKQYWTLDGKLLFEEDTANTQDYKEKNIKTLKSETIITDGKNYSSTKITPNSIELRVGKIKS